MQLGLVNADAEVKQVDPASLYLRVERKQMISAPLPLHAWSYEEIAGCSSVQVGTLMLSDVK